MKKVLLLPSLFFLTYALSAQNTFPSSGNVGVGTSSPSYPLDVNGVIHSSHGLLVTATDNGINGLTLAGYLIGPSDASSNVIMQSTGGTGNAFWLTASQYYLKLGGVGGSETNVAPINIDYLHNVGIGTLNTGNGYLFSVAGTAVCDGLTVKNFSGNKPNATPWADYVFKKEYQLPTLKSLDDYIRRNQHLPDIPTAEEVQKNGLDLAVTQAQFLEKIEQLTLYTIDLQKQMDAMRMQNQELTSRLERLEQALEQSNATKH